MKKLILLAVAVILIGTVITTTKCAIPKISTAPVENTVIIAKVLGIDEDARSLPYIIKSLEDLDLGAIKSAKLEEDNGQKILNLVMESGRNIRVYLTSNYTVDAVKDLDTGVYLKTSNG